MGRKPCEVVQKVSGKRAPPLRGLRRAAQQITLSAGGGSQAPVKTGEHTRHRFQPVPAGRSLSPPPQSGCRAGRTASLPRLLRYLRCFGAFTGLSYPDAIYFAKC